MWGRRGSNCSGWRELSWPGCRVFSADDKACTSLDIKINTLSENSCLAWEHSCNRFILLWKKHEDRDNSITKDDRYLFHIIYELYGQIYGICQNIGTAIRDYFDIYQKIKSNISKKEKDFKTLPVQDLEVQVSERIDEINRETENCLLVNPSESILGLSAVRIGLESLIIIKIGDKMRQHIKQF